MKVQSSIYTGTAIASIVDDKKGVVLNGKTFVSDATKTFILYTIMHSWPTVNQNGYTYTPAMLARSIPTGFFQPLNFEHQQEGALEEEAEAIVGAMLEVFVEGVDVEEAELLPESPIPVKAIGVIWNRGEAGRTIIESIGDGETEYKVSIEIIRGVASDAWVVTNDDGSHSYKTEISNELFVAWQNKEYDKIALAVGGDGTGESHLFGAGFTLTPADENAGIETVLSSRKLGDEYLCAISTHINSDKPNPKEVGMKKRIVALAKKVLLNALGGFGVTVEGGALTLTLNGQTIKQPPYFYLYSDNDSVYASLDISKDSGLDGFQERASLTYDSDNQQMVETEDSAETLVNSLKDNQAAINAVRAEYEGYVSPEDAESATAAAVAAALAKVNDSGGDSDAKVMSEEDVQKVADEAAGAALAKRDEEDAKATERSAQLVEAGLPVTNSRLTQIKSFAVDKSGDDQFASYLNTLVNGQKEMGKALEKEGVVQSDDLKNAISTIDGVSDDGFKAVLMSHGGKGQSTFSPSVESGGSGARNSDDSDRIGKGF